MASTTAPQTGPQSTNAPIQLTATRLSVVTVRGVNYEFSITGSISGKDCTALVRDHIECLLAASGRDSFDKITSVITKNDNPKPQEPLFAVQSCKVEYKSSKGKVKKEDVWKDHIVPLYTNQSIDPGKFKKVDQFFKATQASLVDLTSGAPSPTPQPAPSNPNIGGNAAPPPATTNSNVAPAAPAQQPASPPIAESPRTMITPFKNRAKRMPNPTGAIEHFQVDRALAAQLSKMPNVSNGKSKYNGVLDVSIAGKLREKYVKYISDHEDDYVKTPKFPEIIDTLKKALTNDSTKLENACNNIYSSNTRLFGWTNTNVGQLKTLLTNSISSMNKDQKCDLIKIHNEYVINGGFLNENSFLEVFVKVHNPKSEPDKFEVVVINPNDNTDKSHLCDDNSPGSANRLPVSEKSCAFLWVDSQGRYQSIPRSKSASQVRRALTNAPIADDGNKNRDVSKELGLLIDLYDCYDNVPLKTYILGHFATDYPQAFERIKHFVWLNDCKKWDDNPNHTGNRPGSHGDLQYGDRTLKAMSQDDLATLLTSNREKILAVGRDSKHVI